MLKVLKYKGKSSVKTLQTFLSKRKVSQKDSISVVRKIIKHVKEKGDKAVLNYEKKFSNFKTNR